jgi:hypothetical protein
VNVSVGQARASRGTGSAVGVLLIVSLLGSCGSARTTRLPDIDTLRCARSATPSAESSSLSALARVGADEHAPLHGTVVHSGHGNAGPEPPIDVQGSVATALAQEVRAAAQVACEFRTTDAAARSGYVLSSVYDQGVGTHWTNWHLIDAPFDPTRPAMLLYAPHLGRTQLVGFSYWVRTSKPAGPEGFAGTADRWHRHFGLCFDRTGMLQRENVRSPALCDGVYINGADMWMLHAWIEPGAGNVWGLFAALNPQLCSRTVPDIERCPGFG